MLSRVETVAVVSEHHQSQVLLPYASFPAPVHEELPLGLWVGSCLLPACQYAVPACSVALSAP